MNVPGWFTKDPRECPSAIVAAAVVTYAVMGLAVFNGPVTLDETGTWWVISGDFGSLPMRAWTSPKLPFYYQTVKAWSLIGGDSVYFLRVFSVLCSLAAMIAVYRLCARLFDARTAGWSLVFLALNSSFLINGTLARPYPLALLLVLVSTIHLVIFAQTGKGRSFFVWQATLLLSFFVHLYFLAVGLLHLLVILAHPNRRFFFDAVYKWLVYGLGLLVLFPVLMQLLLVRDNTQAMVFFDPSLTTTFSALLPVSFVVPFGLMLALAVLHRYDVRRVAAALLSDPRYRLVLIWALFPALLFGGYFIIAGEWLVLNRYIYYQVPALAIILSLLIQRLPAGEVVAVLLVTLVCTALSVRADLGSLNYSAPDLTSVADDIEATDPTGECTLVTASLFYESSFPGFYDDDLHRSFFGAFTRYFIKHRQIVLPRSLTPENAYIFVRRLGTAKEQPCLFDLAFEYNEVLTEGKYSPMSDYLRREIARGGFTVTGHDAGNHGSRHWVKE